MDINPMAQPSKMSAQTQSQVAAAGASQFEDVFKKTVKTVSGEALQAAEESKKQKFFKDKIVVEHGEGMSEEDIEEPIHKTIDEIKKRIKALVELERRGWGLKL